MPLIRLVFVVTMPMQPLPGWGAAGWQCRELVKASGYDFKLDDYRSCEWRCMHQRTCYCAPCRVGCTNTIDAVLRIMAWNCGSWWHPR
jgi:hypothetical protein